MQLLPNMSKLTWLSKSSRGLTFLTLDLLIWSLLLPIITLPLGIFFIWKKLINLCVSLIRPDLKPISNNDLMVARNTVKKKKIVDIGFILKVEGAVSLKELRENFTHHFLQGMGKGGLKDLSKSDPFYSLYCTFESFLGYLFIKRVEKLNLKELIWEQDLNDSDAQSFFSTWLHAPYRRDDIPRWEMLLLHDKRKGDGNREESYVAFRMHHGLIDGFGMLLIVDKLCGTQSPYLVAKEPEPSFSEKMSMLFEMPREILTYWIKAKLTSWPLAQINKVDKSNQMFIGWGTFDIAPLKTLRRQLNLPFSTILYVLQTGALRRHLKATGRAHEITETLPVFHTIPKPNHPRTVFTNHWTFVKLQTPFRNENPLERVLETEALYNSFIKTRLHISVPIFFLGFVNLLPIALSILDLNFRLSAYKASLSSMVRAPVQYKLFERLSVSNIYHTFCTKDLCPETVLYTTTASHNKQIDITMTAAPELVKSQEAMDTMAQKHFGDELEELLRLANNSIYSGVKGDGCRGNVLQKKGQ